VLLQLPAFMQRSDDQITLQGDTIREAFRNLRESNLELASRLWDYESDKPKYYHSIFVNNKHIRTLQGADTPLGPDDIITIMPALAQN
jgi:sulfur-carrier protein